MIYTVYDGPWPTRVVINVNYQIALPSRHSLISSIFLDFPRFPSPPSSSFPAEIPAVDVLLRQPCHLLPTALNSGNRSPPSLTTGVACAAAGNRVFLHRLPEFRRHIAPPETLFQSPKVPSWLSWHDELNAADHDWHRRWDRRRLLPEVFGPFALGSNFVRPELRSLSPTSKIVCSPPMSRPVPSQLTLVAEIAVAVAAVVFRLLRPFQAFSDRRFRIPHGNVHRHRVRWFRSLAGAALAPIAPIESPPLLSADFLCRIPAISGHSTYFNWPTHRLFF